MPTAKIRRYLRHGTLPQFLVFETVARLGSFTRAGEELYLAQPTVSVQIRKLTETVGAPLLEQVGKRIHLTEAGRTLYAACHDVFTALAVMEDGLAEARGLRAGRLHLGVTTAAKYFAPRLLAAFGRTHPGIEIALRIHNRQALMERFAANADDVYIFVNPPVEAGVVSEPLLPNPLVAFAPAQHPLAHARRIPFARLAQEPFLMREPGSGIRADTLAAFTRHGVTPAIRMELDTDEAIKQAILAGLGISFLPRHTYGVGSDPAGLTVLDIEGLPIDRHWQLVHPGGKRLSAAAREFVTFAHTQAPALAAAAMTPTEVARPRGRRHGST